MTHAQTPFRSTAPAAAPVTLAEAKAHLRVDHAEDDAMITGMIAAATDHLDGWTGTLGRCLVSQGWTRDADGFPCGAVIPLPFRSASDVEVSYFAPGATERAIFSSDAWFLIQGPRGAAVRLAAGAAWPATADRPDAVRVVGTYGFGAASDVPPAIRAAILLMIGDLYKNRETTGVGAGAVGAIAMSTTVDSLLAPWRMVGI